MFVGEPSPSETASATGPFDADADGASTTEGELGATRGESAASEAHSSSDEAAGADSADAACMLSRFTE